MDLTLANRVLTGTEAADWGLVSRAVPGDQLASEVESLVSTLSGGASNAPATAKRLVRESRDRTMSDQMQHEADAIARLVLEPDGVEGVDAFLGKRQPIYR